VSEQERFLLTFDSARGVPVKVERIGEAGELTELDLQGFLRQLTPGPAAAAPPQQIIINVYGGGTPVVEQAPGPPQHPPVYADQPGPYYKPKKKEE
jgi:hypothetical protein